MNYEKMSSVTKLMMQELVGFMEATKKELEEKGLIPTLDEAILDLKEKLSKYENN